MYLCEENQIEQLAQDMRSLLTSDYQMQDGSIVKGQAITYLMQELRTRGWKIGSAWKLESDAENLGLIVTQARVMKLSRSGNYVAHGKCTIVTT